MNDWVYDKETESWVWGDRNNGCGVYLEDGLWYGNVCLKGCKHMTTIGPCPTMEKCQTSAIETYNKMKAEIEQENNGV